jgi:hypothetical protein
MTIRPMFDMMEATRLTREGRLADAMAVLRGAGPGTGETPTAPSGIHDAEAREGDARASVLLDMVPPSKDTGGSWTMPPSGAGRTPAQRDDTRRPWSQASATALDRLREGGSENGFEPMLDCGSKPAMPPLAEGARFEEHSFANKAGRRMYNGTG